MLKENLYTTKRARRIVQDDPEVDRLGAGKSGLFQGHLEWRLTDNSKDFETQTIRREVCDTGIFITVSKDAVDIGLTHYFPNAIRRKAHSYVVNAYRQKRHLPGVRFATLVTSYPYHDRDKDKQEARLLWRKLVEVTRRFNNNHMPDIIHVHPQTIHKTAPSDLIVSRRRIDNDWEISIQLTNSPYKKVFRQSKAQEAARRKPVSLSLS